MSLASVREIRQAGCFPRVSGDEPSRVRRGSTLGEFSPRERG